MGKVRTTGGVTHRLAVGLLWAGPQRWSCNRLQIVFGRWGRVRCPHSPRCSWMTAAVGPRWPSYSPKAVSLEHALRLHQPVPFPVACLGVDSERAPVKFASKARVSGMAAQDHNQHIILAGQRRTEIGWKSLSPSLRNPGQPRADTRIRGQGSAFEKHLLSFIQVTNTTQMPERYLMDVGPHQQKHKLGRAGDDGPMVRSAC